MTQPLLLHVFPTFDVGGQQTRFATIANRLGPAFRHRLISLDGGDRAISLLDPGIDFALIPTPSRTRNFLGHQSGMGEVFRQLKPDIITTYNWGAIEWAIFNRIFMWRKHIHLEDGFGPDEADRQKWRRRITRQLMLRRSIVVVPSRNLLWIATAKWRLKSERVFYIPNGIDSTRFDFSSRPAATPFFQRGDDECVIGAFSPLRPEKNIARLLRAFAELHTSSRRLRLVVCGDGTEFSSLRNLSGQLRIANAVTFTGHVPRPEAVMGAFDVFAITSDTEQMPYSVLEAMAARLPIVGTAVGDIPFMVSEENRPYIVPRDSPEALVASLKQLSSDARLRHRVGTANRLRVDRDFGIEQMTRAFQALFSAPSLNQRS